MTCYPGMQKNLKRASTDRVVVDGKCVTSQGPATAIEFALQLVACLQGSAKAETTGKAMLLAEGSQLPY